MAVLMMTGLIFVIVYGCVAALTSSMSTHSEHPERPAYCHTSARSPHRAGGYRSRIVRTDAHPRNGQQR